MGESRPSNYPRGKAESKQPLTSKQNLSPQSPKRCAIYKHIYTYTAKNEWHGSNCMTYYTKDMTRHYCPKWHQVIKSSQSKNKNEHCCRVHGSAHQCEWQIIRQKHNENDTKSTRQSPETTDRMTNQTRTNKAVHTAKVASSEPKKITGYGRTDRQTDGHILL